MDWTCTAVKYPRSSSEPGVKGVGHATCSGGGIEFDRLCDRDRTSRSGTEPWLDGVPGGSGDVALPGVVHSSRLLWREFTARRRVAWRMNSSTFLSNVTASNRRMV